MKDRYKVLKRLGAGGMGEVYLAHDTNLDRQVAIKIIKPECLSDARVLKRTFREGKILAGLSHSSLVSVYEMDLRSSPPFIVQEFVEGKDLRQLIDDADYMSEKEALRFCEQMADVLGYLHSKGICHRDIKPENIMVDGQSRFRLMDFGLALSRDFTRMTSEGSFVGTIKYLPPEVVKGRDSGPQGDIFQLGVVLYEVLTGKDLVGEFTTVTEFVSLLYTAPWEDHDVLPGVTPPVSALIKSCVAFNAEDRLSDGRALKKYLSGKMQEHQTPRKTAHPPRKTGSSAESSAEVKKQPTKTASFRIWGSILLLLFLATSITVFRFSNGSAHPALESGTRGMTMAELQDISRATLFFPQGFFLFLPSHTGTDLHWSYECGDGSPELTAEGTFTKVVGGWKTLYFATSDLPKGTLTVFDGQKTFARVLIAFPRSVLKKPFTVDYSYEDIVCDWEFHGKCEATLFLEQLHSRDKEKRTYEVDVTGSSHRVPLSQIGFSCYIRATLLVKGLPAENTEGSVKKIAEVTGTTDFALKCRLPYDENREYSSHRFNVGQFSGGDTISNFVVLGRKLFLLTEGGFLHCFQISRENNAFFQHRWKKDLNRFAKEELAPKIHGFVPGKSLPGRLYSDGKSVILYGLGDSRSIVSFDDSGNWTFTEVAYPDDGQVYGAGKAYFFQGQHLLVARAGEKSKSSKYHCFLYTGKKQLIDLYSDGFPEYGGSTFTETGRHIAGWIAFGGKNCLCFIDCSREKPQLRIIDSRTLVGNNGEYLCAAADKSLAEGLFSTQRQLFYLRTSDESSEGTSSVEVEEIPFTLPRLSGIAKLLKIGPKEYACLCFTGIDPDSSLPAVHPGVSLRKIVIANKTVKVAKTETRYPVITEPYRCPVRGPRLVGSDAFCFSAGLNFLLLSTKDFTSLFHQEFYSDVTDVIVSTDAIVVEGNSDGFVYSLNRPLPE